MGRHVLIADPDPATARLLAPALRHRGHQVSAVRSGPRALETCVLRPPDLVLFDAACPLLDAQTFRQILRSNPHTAPIPILVTGGAESAALPASREGFLQKPFNIDEVVARIDQTFRRLDAARETQRGDRGLEGALGQLGVPDLLQVLGQNRNSGVLRLTGPRGSASIRLSGGAIAEASGENVSGLKALFRLLQWREGLFAFQPGESPDPGDIARPVEEVLLEGLRQADELPGLLAALPGASVRFALSPSAALEGERDRATAEVLSLLRSGATVGEVLDRSRTTDHAAAQAMLRLLRKRLLVPAAGEPAAAREARQLVPTGGSHALRARVHQIGRGDGGRTRGKILLAAVEDELPPFVERLSRVPEVRLDATLLRAAAPLGFGTLGAVEIDEDLRIDLLLLPAGDAASPLWQPFASRALGAIVLLAGATDSGALALVRFLCEEQALPVVLPGLSALPFALAEVKHAPAPTGADPWDALHELLALVTRNPAKPVV